MRIYYDHQLTSLQDAGGASRYHYELARYLAGVSDIETTLFLGLNSTVYPYTQLRSSSMSVISLHNHLSKGPARYAVNEAMANTVALLAGRFDIYHPSHHRIMPLLRARRIIVTHHDCTYERFLGFRFTERVLRAKRDLFPRADMIICISESCRQDLFHYYGVEPARTRVIHHGFTPLQRTSQGAVELARHIRRDFVLYVGSRPQYKNFHSLVRAFATSELNRDFDLLVLGGGAMSDDHQALIRELGLTASVIAVPVVSDDLLAEAYATARLLAYPSMWEGFGLPPLEAMHLNCPVLACNIASLPEVCGTAPFYFEVNSLESLRDALVRAATEETARARAIMRGREVVSRYSWEKCAAQTLALYRECL